MDTTLRILRYIKNKLGQGILLSNNQNATILALYNSDLVSCLHIKKYVSGYCVKLGDSSVTRKSKKKTTTSRSSAEAKHRSMVTTINELIWLIGLLKELGVQVNQPAIICTDSKAPMQIAGNLVCHERTKYLEVDFHFIREKIGQGILITNYISTKDQPADLLIKGLSNVQHHYLKSKLVI